MNYIDEYDDGLYFSMAVVFPSYDTSAGRRLRALLQLTAAQFSPDLLNPDNPVFSPLAGTMPVPDVLYSNVDTYTIGDGPAPPRPEDPGYYTGFDWFSSDVLYSHLGGSGSGSGSFIGSGSEPATTPFEFSTMVIRFDANLAGATEADWPVYGPTYVSNLGVAAGKSLSPPLPLPTAG